MSQFPGQTQDGQWPPGQGPDWFDSNAPTADPLAGYSPAEQDFLRRNRNADGSYDVHRLSSAFQPTSQRPYDSQTTNPAEQAANRGADAGPGRASFGGGGYGTASGYGLLPQVPYTPFGQTFTPSQGALPADLLTASRYAELPADLVNAKWDRTFQAPDATAMANDPVVQARLALGRDAFEKSAAATGTLRTGGFAQGLHQFGQQVATDEYSKIYDRAMREFEGAYGMFQGDLTRRQGVAGQRFGQNLEDRAFRSGVYGQQWARDFGQFQDTAARHRNEQLDPFGMGMQTGYLGLARDQHGLQRDQFGLQREESQFGRDRTTRMDDFGIWKYGDESYYDRLFRQAELGMPR